MCRHYDSWLKQKSKSWESKERGEEWGERVRDQSRSSTGERHSAWEPKRSFLEVMTCVLNAGRWGLIIKAETRRKELSAWEYSSSWGRESRVSVKGLAVNSQCGFVLPEHRAWGRTVAGEAERELCALVDQAETWFRKPRQNTSGSRAEPNAPVWVAMGLPTHPWTALYPHPSPPWSVYFLYIPAVPPTLWKSLEANTWPA